MRNLVVLYVANFVPRGDIIKLESLYSGIYQQFRKVCEQLGLTSSKPEPKWKNQIRYGLWEARKKGLIKHVGSQKSGQWLRV
jgi:hypothetical protein